MKQFLKNQEKEWIRRNELKKTTKKIEKEWNLLELHVVQLCICRCLASLDLLASRRRLWPMRSVAVRACSGLSVPVARIRWPREHSRMEMG